MPQITDNQCFIFYRQTLSNLAVANHIAANTISGTLTTASQPTITEVGALKNLSVTGTIQAGELSATTMNLRNLTGLENLSVSGTVQAANLYGTLTKPSQPNITSVGTLSSLNVSGTTTLGTISATTYLGVAAAKGIVGFTSATPSGNYLVPDGVYSIIVEIVGGGGAGGGTVHDNTDGVQAAGGGGGGGYAKSVLAVTPGQIFPFTVGAAGIGRHGAVGGDGDSTTFGGLFVGGGTGGRTMASGTVVAHATGGTGGGAIRNGLSFSGADGDQGFRFNTNLGISGRGGNSNMGFGGAPVMTIGTSVIGKFGIGYGAGGSGAFSQRSGNTPLVKAGGNGSPGVIIIHEFK